MVTSLAVCFCDKHEGDAGREHDTERDHASLEPLRTIRRKHRYLPDRFTALAQEDAT